MTRNIKKDACVLWQFLVKAAKDKTYYTYSELERLTGIPPRVQRLGLEQILKYTRDNGYPYLTVLAVRKDTSTPGEGLPMVRPFPQLLAEVQKFDWSKVPNPFLE